MVFQPPIDLSDLPGFLAPVRSGPERVAFVGRCSTKDNQDPRSSIAGQVAEASALLRPGEHFHGFYWDVESGMLGLDERGHITDADYHALNVPVPRHGGLPDLLEAVERREYDRVGCERIDRVARDMLASLLVENHLKDRGVPLECANEPRGGGMSSGMLQVRRSGQVRAELARVELLEMSLRGQRQHALNGYRHGTPCYGYIAVLDPDAPPAPNRFGGGRPKHRLALHPDGRRITTVQEAFQRRCQRETYAQIASALEADHDKHPLAEGQRRWSAQRVSKMIGQPKYTGYAVFDRRASRTNQGRLNPISQWVWSREQAHPSIVSLQTWRDAQLVTARFTERRRSGWERVKAAAAELETTLVRVRGNDSHVLYEAGGRQIVLPCGDLPAAVADEVIAVLRGERVVGGGEPTAGSAGDQAIVLPAIRRDRLWITPFTEHGVIVHGRTLRDLTAGVRAALSLRLPGAAPTAEVNPQSAALDALDHARQRYQRDLERAVHQLRADGARWTDVATACRIRLADAQAARPSPG